MPQQQNLEIKVKEIEAKISKLIDVYLEGSLTLEEYQAKKEAFISEKKELQEKVKDFAAGAKMIGHRYFCLFLTALKFLLSNHRTKKLFE